MFETRRLDLPAIELRGAVARMGEQFGEATRRETQELFERRLRAAIGFARQHGRRGFDADGVLTIANQCLAVSQAYHPEGHEEFLGIARGADLTPEQLYVTQGFTDLRDVLCAAAADRGAEGCSSFIVSGERAADGRVILGQTWDLQTDNMPYVRLVHRRPTDGGPETWSLTLTGCLTLIGLNSEGIAMGTTNLHTTDARPGVQYLSILHKAIAARTLADAADAVRHAPRAAAHYYFMADANGEMVGLECSAEHCVTLAVEDGVLVHCNHAISPRIAAVEAPAGPDSTACRHRRLEHLIQRADAPPTVADFQRWLGDHDGGEEAICRHDIGPDGISTNACVIMRPQAGELHACRGPAHRGAWRTATI